MNFEEILGGLTGQNAQNNQSLQDNVGQALSGLGTDQVTQMIGDSAQEMNPQQRGQLVGSLLNGLGQSGVDVSSLLNQLGVNPQVAQDPTQASPEEVAALTAHAHENHPSIFQSAMGVYQNHPTLIKTLGMLAVAAITKHVNDSRSST